MEGKRKNLGQRHKYKIRMAAAVFAYNRTTYWATDIYNSVYGKLPATPWRVRKLRSERLRNRKNKPKAARKLTFPVPSEKGDRFYGDNPTTPDFSDEDLSFSVDQLQLTLVVDEEMRNTIEQSTLEQANSDIWFEQRRKRITASFAGKIFKLKDTTDNTEILNKLFDRNQWKGTKEAKEYGKQNESIAIEAYEELMGFPKGHVKKAGFVVYIDSNEQSFNGIFGASPDGYVGSDGLVEIKCPFSLRDAEPKDWPVKSKQNSSIIFSKDGSFTLKQTHEHYHQVVMQLYVTGRQFCDYVIWTPHGIERFRVQKSTKTDNLWDSMKEKLAKFWKLDFAPEIVNSRFDRGYKEYRCPESRLPARLAKAETRKRRIDKDVSNKLSKKQCIDNLNVGLGVLHLNDNDN
jgi:hypothetical protein